MVRAFFILTAFAVASAPAANADAKRDFIHHQIIDGKEDEVRRKISKFPSLLTVPYTKRSKVLPMHHAAQYSSAALVKFMIERGADLNAKCYNDFTALHLCQSPESAKVLIEAGADASCASSFGQTALQYVALSGRKPVAEAMIKAGVEVDVLTATAMGMSEEAMRLAKADPKLLETARGFSLNRNESPLGIAAFTGNLELVKVFVELGADVNSYSRYPSGGGGHTPLTNAVSAGHEDVVEFLLRQGADPNVEVGKFQSGLLELSRNEKIVGMLKKAMAAKQPKPGED